MIQIGECKMPVDLYEGPEESGSTSGVKEKTGFGELSEEAQRKKSRRTAYLKLLMNQLDLSHEQADDLIERKGLDFVIEKFGTPRKPDDMEEDVKSLKDELLGMKSKRASMMKELNEY